MEYRFSQKRGSVYIMPVLYTQQNLELIGLGMCQFHLNRLSIYVGHLAEHEGLFQVKSAVNFIFLTLSFLSGINERQGWPLLDRKLYICVT
jgi:hypothetical protein